MEEESITIRMVASMMESGTKTRNQDEGKCFLSMALSMMDNGKEIRCTDKEFISLAIEIDSKEASVMA